MSLHAAGMLIMESTDVSTCKGLAALDSALRQVLDRDAFSMEVVLLQGTRNAVSVEVEFFGDHDQAFEAAGVMGSPECFRDLARELGCRVWTFAKVDWISTFRCALALDANGRVRWEDEGETLGDARIRQDLGIAGGDASPALATGWRGSLLDLEHDYAARLTTLLNRSPEG